VRSSRIFFEGKVASNSDEGSHLMSSLNFGDAA